MNLKTTVLGIFFVGVAVTGSGCGNHVQFGLSNTGQSFKQGTSNFTNQLDVLWVVDNSNSMAPLQSNMVNNFNSFLGSFQAKGWDFRMAVTTTDAYKADPGFTGYTSSNANMAMFSDGTSQTSFTGTFIIIPSTPNLNNVFITNATTGINGSGDERAFSSMRTAMNSSLNPSFLRSNSFFAVIILSDEDDFSLNSRSEGSWGSNSALDHCYVDSTMDGIATTPYSGPNHTTTCANQTPPDTVGSYVQYLDQLTATTGAFRRYNVSTITILDSACQKQHEVDTNVAIVGQRYIQLSQEVNGVTGSICDPTYANSLSAIATQIAVLSTQFFLTGEPNPTTFQILVNGTAIPGDPNNGWTYNSAANSIQFHGSAIPPQGANIQVNYTPLEVNH